MTYSEVWDNTKHIHGFLKMTNLVLKHQHRVLLFVHFHPNNFLVHLYSPFLCFLSCLLEGPDHKCLSHSLSTSNQYSKDIHDHVFKKHSKDKCHQTCIHFPKPYIVSFRGKFTEHSKKKNLTTSIIKPRST